MAWQVHHPSLSGAWYPKSADRIRDFLSSAGIEAVSDSSCAAIAPHAGWSFSGKAAARAVASLADSDLIILIGGHLHASQSPQILPFSAYSTPLGMIESDAHFLEVLREEIDLVENPEPDNTTEVLLPLIAALHPRTPVILLRAAPNDKIIGLVKAVEESSRRTGLRPALLGSTDLTHYGDPYGFTPRGNAASAIDWVRAENDKALIDAALELDWRGVIRAGLERRSACSSGAAAAAVYYAELRGCTRGELLSYHTSYEVSPGEIIVGYGALTFPCH